MANVVGMGLETCRQDQHHGTPGVVRHVRGFSSEEIPGGFSKEPPIFAVPQALPPTMFT